MQTIRFGQSYYLLSLPAGYSAAKRWPLLVSFHGGGSQPADHAEMTGLETVCRAAGIVLVLPCGTPATAGVCTWNAGTCCGRAKDSGTDHVGYFAALVDALARSVSIDVGRIFVNGFSNGAMLAYRLGVESRVRLAGVCGVGGTVPECFLSRVPSQFPRVLHIHGMADPDSRWDGGENPRGTFDAVSVGDHVAYWTDVDQGRLSSETTADALVVDFPGLRLVALPQGGHTWPGGGWPKIAYQTTSGLVGWRHCTAGDVGPLVSGWSASRAICAWVTRG